VKFSKVADMHERLRLGADRVEQLSRLENKEEALYVYEFFFPSTARVSAARVKSLIADEIASFYDVVDACLTDDEPLWSLLASESSQSGSRGLSAAEVQAFPYKAAAFTEIAYKFNEIEARLIWRYLMKSSPVISKRTFFGALARLHGIPPYLLKMNMSVDTIIRLYEDPKSISILEHWWENPQMFPSPHRWRAWTKMHPPTDEVIAMVIPNGELYYTWQGNARKRNGDRLPNPMKINEFREFVGDTILDLVSYDKPHNRFDERYPFSAPNAAQTFDLSEHGSWERVLEVLNDDTTQCVRFINPELSFTPDSEGGYIMYPHRSKVFLRLNEIKNGKWELSALDGLDDYVSVVTVDAVDPTFTMFDHESCIVVEGVASSVNTEGNITGFALAEVRNDLGISDVTQYTELIERGLSYDTKE
tara:strand:+ start:19361 stop:20617 length:1257 start_codon:yes stop_codon:yes gene_type:complete